MEAGLLSGNCRKAASAAAWPAEIPSSRSQWSTTVKSGAYGERAPLKRYRLHNNQQCGCDWRCLGAAAEAEFPRYAPQRQHGQDTVRFLTNFDDGAHLLTFLLALLGLASAQRAHQQQVTICRAVGMIFAWRSIFQNLPVPVDNGNTGQDLLLVLFRHLDRHCSLSVKLFTTPQRKLKQSQGGERSDFCCSIVL